MATTIEAPRAGAPPWLSSLLQTSDSLFPSGGYAHSYGLEEMVAMGRVPNAAALQDFLDEQILPAMERLELPYLRFAQEAAEREDLDTLLELDEEIAAWKVCREIREAGESQGRQLLRMLDQIFDHDFARRFQEAAAARRSPCQQITVAGILRSAQGAEIEVGLSAWLYQGVSNFCAASVKLLRLGEVACQRVIRASLEPQKVASLIQRSLKVSRSEAGWFNPLLDIASSRHETAFSRLFIS